VTIEVDSDFPVKARRIVHFEEEQAEGFAGPTFGVIGYYLGLPGFEEITDYFYLPKVGNGYATGQPIPYGFYRADFYQRQNNQITPLVNRAILVSVTEASPRSFNTNEKFANLVRMEFQSLIDERDGPTQMPSPPEGEVYAEQVSPPTAP
jgi:hypothetical protein